MKSTGNYFYVKKVDLRSDFTQIPNALFYIDLSATEKLILAYLLSNSETFRVTNYRIAKSVGSDFRTVKKALKKFRDMKIMFQVTAKTLGMNINEIIKLAHVREIIDENDGNSTNSNSTNSTITNSNPTTDIVGELPSSSSNSTTSLPGELPNNNTNQQEIKEEKQKEAFSSSSTVDIQNEVSDYLKTPSKFFYGNNQRECSKVYERYRVERDTKMTSIRWFEVVFYYHMLKMTNTKDVQELNQRLSKGGLSLNLNDIFKTVQRIVKEKEVNDDYKKEFIAVIGTSNNSQNNNK